MPEQINGTFMMLGRQIYFDKNKKLIKSRDNKNISDDKSIKLCEKYNVGLQNQQLEQKYVKELIVMIMEKVKEGRETI